MNKIFIYKILYRSKNKTVSCTNKDRTLPIPPKTTMYPL